MVYKIRAPMFVAADLRAKAPVLTDLTARLKARPFKTYEESMRRLHVNTTYERSMRTNHTNTSCESRCEQGI